MIKGFVIDFMQKFIFIELQKFLGDKMNVEEYIKNKLKKEKLHFTLIDPDSEIAKNSGVGRTSFTSPASRSMVVCPIRLA